MKKDVSVTAYVHMKRDTPLPRCTQLHIFQMTPLLPSTHPAFPYQLRTSVVDGLFLNQIKYKGVMMLQDVKDSTIMALFQDPPIKSYLNHRFQVSQLLKYDGNKVITQKLYKDMLWWEHEYLQIASYEV